MLVSKLISSFYIDLVLLYIFIKKNQVLIFFDTIYKTQRINHIKIDNDKINNIFKMGRKFSYEIEEYFYEHDFYFFIFSVYSICC